MLFVLFSAAVNTLLIAWVVRKLVGAPVGWPRTIVLSLIVTYVTSSALGFVSGLLGLPGADAVPEESLSGYALFLLLFLAWVVAAEAAVLTVCEIFVPTGSLPGPIEWARSLPGQLRRRMRLATITRIMTSHGLSGLIRGRGTSKPDAVIAARLRDALADGGVTFVKLGQTLATRPDLLPPVYISELSTLHSEVPAEPWSSVEPQVTADLGRPVREVFAEIETEPLAAASVAQVYRARLTTGEDVVVKVQRPQARSQATADLDIVLRLGRWAEARTSWGRRTGARDLAEGFVTSVHEELDYRIEAANMRAIRRSSGEGVHVPHVWTEFSGPRLLVMEYVPGTPLSRAHDAVASLPAETRTSLANDLFSSVVRQVVVGGVFHCDLHPGNIMLTETEDGPRLTLLDFGSVGRLDSSSRESLGLLILAFQRQDSVAAADALSGILQPPDRVDDRALERDVGDVMLSSGDSASLFSGVVRVVLRHGFQVPAMAAAAFRAMATLEGSLKLLDPEFDLLTAARDQASGVLGVADGADEVKGRLETQIASSLPLLLRMPRRLDRITAEIESGRLAAALRPFGGPDDKAFAQSLIREATTAMLCAALALAGVAMVLVGGGPALIGTVHINGWLGSMLLLFAFVLGTRLLVRGFRES